jgi:hypothetical protein
MNNHATIVTLSVMLLISASAILAVVVWCGILIRRNSGLRTELAIEKFRHERDNQTNEELMEKARVAMKHLRVKSAAGNPRN